MFIYEITLAMIPLFKHHFVSEADKSPKMPVVDHRAC